MLRVRPIQHTSRLDDYAGLFTALGLRCVHHDAGWLVMDSGDGLVGLREVAAGSAADDLTMMGFEIRDREIFVRRTREDGTRAELVDTGHGPSARVTAPDGLTFLADPGPDRSAPGPGPLTVLQLWRTPDPESARKVLADIGARPVPPRPGAETVFRAKNGGLIAVHPGEHTLVELAFEYDGDLAALAERLADAGVSAEVGDGGALRLCAPAGSRIKVIGSQHF